MELQSIGPSTPSTILDEEGNVIDSRAVDGKSIQFVFEDIHWSSEISQEEAFRRLEVTLYPFKKVNRYGRVKKSLVLFHKCVVDAVCFLGAVLAFFRGF